MPYDAITIDTNSFIELGINLEAGLLSQLKQFKDGPTDLILSEIVTRELLRHLQQNLKKARDGAVSALGRIEHHRLAEGEDLERVKAAAAAIGDSRAVARSRLAKFAEATGAEPVPASLCPMDELLKSYFSAHPPFDPAGPKKSEFPDAIALLSLEKWAKDAGKTILAVSADTGWAAFAADSDQIDVEKDLARALEIVQEHAEAAETAVSAFIAAIEAGEVAEEAASLRGLLGQELSNWSFNAEGHGSFMLEVDSTELELSDFEFDKIGDDYDITIVRIGSDSVVARIGVTITAKARAEFSLSVWDSVDKEEIGMGGASAETDEEFDGVILLTLAGDLAGAADELEVSDLELVDALGEVDFGEIGFDPEDYDDYDDFDALLDAKEPPGESEGDAPSEE